MNQEQAVIDFESSAESFWSSLSKDEQLKCFHSVCKRIYLGDIVENGSYRHVLYNVFGFGSEAYLAGMKCGYMEIHNKLFQEMERQ